MPQPSQSQPSDEKKQPPPIHVAAVVRHGDKLVLPANAKIRDMIKVLERWEADEETQIVVQEKMPVSPWDGGIALGKAIEQLFGVMLQTSIPGMWGPEPPQQIAVECGVGKTVQVPWGGFSLPNIDGQIQCAAAWGDNRTIVFQFVAKIRKKHEPAIRELMKLTRELAQTESIYQKQAIRVRFFDESGDRDPLMMPKFMDLSKVEPTIFADSLQREIDTNIMSLLRHSDKVRAAGTPLKRGVLMCGTYGVGKTLLSANIAKVATENNWTFVYVENVQELPDAIKFAQVYQPCVIFAEDVDRVTGGDRSEALDEILNHLDGISTKGAEILTVLTTNDVGVINPAMLRPGRIDVPLFVDPPDAVAVQKLIRMYGKNIDPTEDLAEVGVLLEGKIPAVIREVVERSKLEVISRTKGGDDTIRAIDLIGAAQTYLKAQQRLRPPVVDRLEKYEAVGVGLAKGLTSKLYPKVEAVDNGRVQKGNGGVGEVRQ